jgi:hypothetical protein
MLIQIQIQKKIDSKKYNEEDSKKYNEGDSK